MEKEEFLQMLKKLPVEQQKKIERLISALVKAQESEREVLRAMVEVLPEEMVVPARKVLETEVRREEQEGGRNGKQETNRRRSASAVRQRDQL